MKINWGTGIAIFYALFVVIMIYMVVSASQNSVDPVQKNYYDKDLNYEAFRKSRENTILLDKEIDIKYQKSTENIEIHFPKEMTDISGQVTLYRPSNKFQDKHFKIFTNEHNAMVISTKELSSGLWRVLIDWNSGANSYFKEQRITL